MSDAEKKYRPLTAEDGNFIQGDEISNHAATPVFIPVFGTYLGRPIADWTRPGEALFVDFIARRPLKEGEVAPLQVAVDSGTPEPDQHSERIVAAMCPAADVAGEPPAEKRWDEVAFDMPGPTGMPLYPVEAPPQKRVDPAADEELGTLLDRKVTGNDSTEFLLAEAKKLAADREFLRDQFAAACITGILARGGQEVILKSAELAYAVADQMLLVRTLPRDDNGRFREASKY